VIVNKITARLYVRQTFKFVATPLD
jgi:hypothetical protein